MAVLKCKMCGGSIDYKEGDSVATCEYCGTKQTLPKLDDDKKANLFDRANHLRRNNEFDKATAIYEQILSEDKEDAEVYWSLVLCRYGIEYVEDPNSHKRMPTVNRTQFTSILNDGDYKKALELADEAQKELYEKEAETIENIQKDILDISNKEEPFDVFICYKESDNQGRRTVDSVLAMDLYKELTAEGFKVFFARVTLEDKLGSAYEPYIFAALNSAKVMIVLGTRKENFDSTWVKNEWKRYLSLIGSGERKTLIPAYRDMDPYDLPEEFSFLQAQDMSKIGFMQDLVRGVGKIINKGRKTNTDTGIMDTLAMANVSSVLKRAYIFLEDGETREAEAYFERVLDQDPECAEAYLGKLLIELGLKNEKDLEHVTVSLAERNNYLKTMRFADSKLKKRMRAYEEAVSENYTSKVYEETKRMMRDANDEEAYRIAAKYFESIASYKDSKKLANKCYEKAEEYRKDLTYTMATTLMLNKTSADYEKAIEKLKTIEDYKDVESLIEDCEKTYTELKISELKEAKKKRNIIISAIATLVLIVVSVLVYNNVIVPRNMYEEAESLFNNGDYSGAAQAYKELGDYQDARNRVYICYFNEGEVLYNKGKYEEAIMCYELAEGYGESSKKISDCNRALIGEELYNKISNAKVGDFITLGTFEQDNKSSTKNEDLQWQVLAIENDELLLVTRYAIDCRRYEDQNVYTSWAECSLRKWLNNGFISSTFTEAEKSLIITSDVYADNSNGFYSWQGEDTQDKVFLLSASEVKTYFKNDTERQCQTTAYAKSKGAAADRYGRVWWWMRNMGNVSYYASTVRANGTLSDGSDYVDYDTVLDATVRPAMRISLKSK